MDRLKGAVMAHLIFKPPAVFETRLNKSGGIPILYTALSTRTPLDDVAEAEKESHAAASKLFEFHVH